MTNAVIRECTENDLNRICEMEKEWVDEDIMYGQVAADRQELLKRLGPYFLVAEDESGIVGFSYGSVRTSPGFAVIPEGQQYFEIDEIYVAPESRSRGIGGVLLESLIDIARTNAVDKLLVYSATKDLERVLKFYRDHGFKNWHVQMYR